MKRIVSICIIFVLLFAQGSCEEMPAFDLSAKASILIDGSTGRVLYENNADEKLPIASVNKIMTMLLIIEAVDSGRISMSDMVCVSEYAASMGGSQVFLEPGEQMSVFDMLKAIAVASGNDACVAMAEHIAGSTDAFVNMMNEKAKELGMNNTSFANCNGLDAENHYSTARDVSVMSRMLIRHEKIMQFLGIWMDSLRDGKFGLANTNKLIRFYSGANGIKTGSTSKAGFCLSASAKRDNLQLIAVVLGCPSSAERFSDASKLLDYGFANFSFKRIIEKGESTGLAPVVKGVSDYVNTEAETDFCTLIRKSNTGKITKEIQYNSNITAPVTKGEKVGEIIFKNDGEEIGKINIVSSEEVLRFGFLNAMYKLIYSVLH